MSDAWLAALETFIARRVRRIDMPTPTTVVWTWAAQASASSDDHLIASLDLGGVALRSSGERPKGLPASAPCSLLRKHLEGATLVRIDAGPEHCDLAFRRGPEGARVRLATRPIGIHLVFATPHERSLSIAQLRSNGALRWGGEEAGPPDAASVLPELRSTLRRLERRVRAIQGDLDRALQIDALRSDAAFLRTYGWSVDRGAAELRAWDTSTDPPRERVLALDPAITPHEAADRLFDKARRLERGRGISAARLAHAEAELAQRRALVTRLETSPDHECIAEAHALLRPAAPGRPRPSEPARRTPYRDFVGTGGRSIRVGRSAADNDELLRAHARPGDLWLHVRGAPGSHVIVPLGRGETCPSELLLDAATLAAHFSEARDERVVEIDWLPRGRVRKRKGMPPGKVELDRPKTLALRVEPERLARLLARDPTTD